jgi:hypothetical protein
MKCDRCGEEKSIVEGVFVNTPDTLHNRLCENFDSYWCYECMDEKGILTGVERLHLLNEQRKGEVKE